MVAWEKTATRERNEGVAYITGEKDEIRRLSEVGEARVWQDKTCSNDLQALENRVRDLREKGPALEVAALLAEFVDIAKASLPPGHWYVAALEGIYGESLSYLGRKNEAG